MISPENLEQLKLLDAFWESDSSLPDLFERDILDDIISSNFKKHHTQESLEKIFKQISAILKEEATAKKESEACSKIIEPLLNILGYYETGDANLSPLFDEQRSISQDGQTFIPDYSIFESKKNQTNANKDETTYYDNVELILEAKRVDVGLLEKQKPDSKLDDRASDCLTKITPLTQIRRYLRVTNTEIGILSNGLDWILVTKLGRENQGVYHINLKDLLQITETTGNYELLLYWVAPFSKHFTLENNSKILKDCVDRTIGKCNELEANLKKRLEPLLLKTLNSSSLALKGEAIKMDKKEKIIEESVSFFYMIFYIACLEDRNLLPMANPLYKNSLSLHQLFEDLLTSPNTNKKSKSYIIYNRLKTLSKLVSNGCKGLSDQASVIGKLPIYDPILNIPNYFRMDDSKLKPILIECLQSPTEPERIASFRSLDTVQFGNIYEHILRLDISFEKKSKSFKLKTETGRNFEKATAVFTPPHIVTEMVNNLVEKIEINSWSDIEQFSAIDPCFGSGHFIIELARQVSQKVCDELEPQNVKIENFESLDPAAQRVAVMRYLMAMKLYGVDRSKTCINVAKYSIWLSTALKGYSPLYLEPQLKVGNTLYGETKFSSINFSKEEKSKIREIENLRFKIKTRAFKKNGHGTDTYIDQNHKKLNLALKGIGIKSLYKLKGIDFWKSDLKALQEQQNPFAWLLEFPEVFNNTGGFSCYITNPPYDQLKGSPKTPSYNSDEHKGFRLSTMTKEDIDNFKYLFDNDPYYKDFQDGYKNLFEGFILLKDKILNPSGTYTLIIPNAILGSEQTAKVRDNLWKDGLFKVQEFPEKDSTNKRVFRSRKVACAILYGNKGIESSTHCQIYDNANDLTKFKEGKIGLSDSIAIDEKNLPIVLLTDTQKLILNKLSKFKKKLLNKSEIKEGELNESFNKDFIFPTPAKGRSKIYGTNRMVPNLFTFWPKQDQVEYGTVKGSNITQNKLSDYKNNRIAINGIAGVNDSRVLNGSFIPGETLLNSNVNYVTVDAVSKHCSPYFYLFLINSFAFDNLIRIQKKTNHNSSAMISSLPILETKEVQKKDALAKTMERKISTLSNWLLEDDDQLYLDANFEAWAAQSSILMQEAWIKLNSLIYDAFCIATNDIEISPEDENTICRKIYSGDFTANDFISGSAINARVAREIKTQIGNLRDDIKNLKGLISGLEVLQNQALLTILGLSIEEQKHILSSYSQVETKAIKSLQEFKSNLDEIGVENIEEFVHWSPVA